MIPELGHFSLILALSLTILLSSIPLLGVYKDRLPWIQLARPLALGQCFFVFVSFSCLSYAFYTNDFSVSAVAQNSNSTLPMLYRIAALWGAHEGSLLLWVLILSTWITLLSVYSRSLPLFFTAHILAILGMVSVGFLLFLLVTSNPFARLLPNIPVDGRDLNPLLQDAALTIHPPLLYIGYTGLAIPFAFAVSVLCLGKCEWIWLRWLRPWVLVVFGFLTVGICLGSWWAYYELGWGGWWFWDPVENVSLMPWLISIGLIHSLFLSEKRQILIGWTLLLAITAFALTLMGLCLVRSGVLASVHAFGSDPTRAFFIFTFLILVVGCAFFLYVYRVQHLSHLTNKSHPAVLSRETLILLSTIFLMVSAMTLLLGTLFPLLYEYMAGQKISVGFPYFNAVFIPMMLPFLFLIPLGPITRWGTNTVRDILNPCIFTFVISIILSLILVVWMPPVGTVDSIMSTLKVFVGLFLSFWIIFTTLRSLISKIQRQGSIKKVSLGAWGMILAHTGVAISVIGITVVSSYQIEKEVRMKPGDTVYLGHDSINFVKTDILEGPNYMSYRAFFELASQGITLLPEKRVFLVQNTMMTETAIDPGWFRDIYIALGEKLEGGAWTARVCYKPFIRWIWMGAFMMAFGSILAAIAKMLPKEKHI